MTSELGLVIFIARKPAKMMTSELGLVIFISYLVRRPAK